MLHYFFCLCVTSTHFKMTFESMIWDCYSLIFGRTEGKEKLVSLSETPLSTGSVLVAS